VTGPLLAVRDTERREHGVREVLSRAGQYLCVGRSDDTGGDDQDGADGRQSRRQRAKRPAEGYTASPARTVGRATSAGRAERGDDGLSAGQLIGATVGRQCRDQAIEIRFTGSAHRSTSSIC
jgi:hypothetical protein